MDTKIRSSQRPISEPQPRWVAPGWLLVLGEIGANPLALVLYIATIAVLAFSVKMIWSLEVMKAAMPALLVASAMLMGGEMALVTRLSHGIIPPLWETRRVLVMIYIGLTLALALATWVGTTLYKDPNPQRGPTIQDEMRERMRDPNVQRGMKAMEEAQRRRAAQQEGN